MWKFSHFFTGGGEVIFTLFILCLEWPNSSRNAKKNFYYYVNYHTLGGGGSKPKVWKISQFFLFWRLPLLRTMSPLIVRNNVGGMLGGKLNHQRYNEIMEIRGKERKGFLISAKCEINKYISVLMVFVIVNDNLHSKFLSSISEIVYFPSFLFSI